MSNNIIQFKNHTSVDLTWLKEAIMGEVDIFNFIDGIQFINSEMTMAEPEQKQQLYEYQRAVMGAVTEDPEQLKRLHELLLNMDDDVDERTTADKLGYMCGGINITYNGELKGLHILQIGFIRFIRAITDPIPEAKL